MSPDEMGHIFFDDGSSFFLGTSSSSSSLPADAPEEAIQTSDRGPKTEIYAFK